MDCRRSVHAEPFPNSRGQLDRGGTEKVNDKKIRRRTHLRFYSSVSGQLTAVSLPGFIASTDCRGSAAHGAPGGGGKRSGNRQSLERRRCQSIRLAGWSSAGRGCENARSGGP